MKSSSLELSPESASTTTYLYQGNKTTVTDPTGKWKTTVTDPVGNVVQVTEPNPGGGTVDTLYTYNSLNKLTQVSMTRAGYTQTRTFTYDDAGRVLTAANPENGTVTYTYNSDALLATKTDAKGQQVQYTYDTYKRLTQARRYTPVTYPPYLSEDVNQRTDYYYDTNPFPQYGMTLENAWGRLTAVVSRNPAYSCQPYPFDPNSAFSAPVNTFTYQYSYTQAGLIKKKRMRVDRTGFVNLDAAYTYDNEGRTTSVTYPPVPAYGGGSGAGQFTYSFDSMGRPNQLVDVNNNNAVVVTGVAYGAADQLTQITYDGLQETRSYNSRLQLTRLTAGSVMDLEYRYSGTQNNGQITQQKDWVSGEEVTYGYDSLARLTSAVTTDAPGVTQWGFSFSYDGYGNLTGKTVTKGSPSGGGFAAAYDAATNHQVGQSYDANGNQVSLPSGSTYPGIYDIENRLGETTSLGACEIYGYDSSNKRVWKMLADQTEEFYLYGIDGRRLGTYWTGWTGGAPLLPRDIYQKSTNLYFAGKMIRSQDKTVVLDRLGSVRANLTTGERFSYYPYGEEVGTTAQGREKFGTYFRDATGLDYADQRYYSSTAGRFLSPEFMSGATVANPATWNRYSYTAGDPVNFHDPHGLFAAVADGFCPAEYDSCGEWDWLRGRDNDSGGFETFPCMAPPGFTRIPGTFCFLPPLVLLAPKRAPSIPMFLSFVGATSVRGFNYNTPTTCQGAPLGAFATETFQVLDQYGQPMRVAGMTVEEQITNSTTYITGQAPVVFPPSPWVPTTRPGPTTTNSDGQFLDSPFGGCTSAPAIEKLNQQYRVNYNGIWYTLSPTLNITMIPGPSSLTVFTQLYTFSVTR